MKAILRGDLEELRRYLDGGGDANAVFEFPTTFLPGAESEPEDSVTRSRFLDAFLLPRSEHRGDCSDAVCLLLAHGADANIKDGEGILPLHLCEFPLEMNCLIDGGADIHAWDDDGDQALHTIAGSHRKNAFDLTKVLLRRGADVFSRNRNPHHVGTDAEDGWDAEHCAINGRRAEVAAFLRDVKAAGGWKPYARAPRIELVRLRSLCARGRATPPRELERLFDCPSSATTKAKAARVARPLPKEVFWHVLSYWRTSRDD